MKNHRICTTLAELNSVIAPSWAIAQDFFFYSVYPREHHMKSRCFHRTETCLFRFLSPILFLFRDGKVVPTVPFQGVCEIPSQFLSGMQKHIIKIKVNISTIQKKLIWICLCLWPFSFTPKDIVGMCWGHSSHFISKHPKPETSQNQSAISVSS